MSNESEFDNYSSDPVGVLEVFRDISPSEGFDAIVEVLGEMVEDLDSTPAAADFASRVAAVAVARLSDRRADDPDFADLFGRLAA